MVQPLHPDASAILVRLQKEGVSTLYHFTNVENLPDICQMQALFSKKGLEEVQSLPTTTGGNLLSHDLDQRWGNWDKICLSFTPHIPMAYHRKKEQHLCYFLIAPEVATWQGVLFTDTNAASNNHQQIEGLLGLNLVQFTAIRAIPFSVPNWHQGVQAEILVPNSILFTHVIGVAFVSQASIDYAQQLCDSLTHPSFLLKPQIFTDSPRASPNTIQFPYVKELFLTDVNYDPERLSDMVYLSQIRKNKYSKQKDEYLSIFMQAPLRTQLQVNLFQIDIPNNTKHLIGSRNIEFDNRSILTQRISLDQLSFGKYEIIGKIKNVLWALTRFEITQ